MTTLEETIDNRLERAVERVIALEAVADPMQVEMEAAIASMMEAQMTEVGLLATITMQSEREEQEAMNDWSEWTADEANGYLTRPTIPLGVPLATVIWTRAWKDIIKHIPVTMFHIASFGQIHTIPEDVNITGPPVIGVRI